MKLSKTLLAATAAATLFATGASALSVDQCTQLGGQVNLATSECALTSAQAAEAQSLGWLPGGATATAGLGGVAVSGGALAAGAGVLLAVVLIGDDSSGTTTTTTGSSD